MTTELTELKKKVEKTSCFENKINDANFIETSINQLTKKAEYSTGPGQKCPLLIICKGQGNCRIGNNHKSLLSLFYNISKFQKETDKEIICELQKKSVEAGDKLKQLNAKIIDLEKKLKDENKKTESSFNDLKAKHLIDFFKSNEKTKKKKE